jgi:hypothetical protein
MALRMALSSPAINETEPEGCHDEKTDIIPDGPRCTQPPYLWAPRLLAFRPMTSPVKAAFIYVGPISDHGWSYAHDQARLAMEEELGDMVETTYLESVPEGADAVRALERLARTGP